MINYVNGGIQRDAKVFSAVVGVRLIAWPPGGHYAELSLSRFPGHIVMLRSAAAIRTSRDCNS
jgi:hypothetical protein